MNIDPLNVESDMSKEALKRKERLAELRAKHKCASLPTSAGEALPKPVFRSYKPIDEKLRTTKRDEQDLVRPEDHVKDQLEAAKTEILAKEVDVANLAPRKPDWDLKRDVAPLLEKLERRTQRAIAEIIRERLQADNTNNEDFAEAISSGVSATYGS